MMGIAAVSTVAESGHHYLELIPFRSLWEFEENLSKTLMPCEPTSTFEVKVMTQDTYTQTPRLNERVHIATAKILGLLKETE